MAAAALAAWAAWAAWAGCTKSPPPPLLTPGTLSSCPRRGGDQSSTGSFSPFSPVRGEKGVGGMRGRGRGIYRNIRILNRNAFCTSGVSLPRRHWSAARFKTSAWVG
jgi:hypothetical protein